MSKNHMKIGSNGSNGNGTSMEVVKHAGNGSAVVIEEATAEVVVEEAPAEVVAEKVIEAPKPAPKPEPVISVERRIEKVEELKITIAKYQSLQDARKGLTSFRLGSDGMSATLTLKDSNGTPFSTSNPVVVEAALNHIRQVLNEKIHETEQEINFSV
jgi:hypothetical protein